MICQNCQTNVDDDLIFCTNCGSRLTQSQNIPFDTANQPTVVLPTSQIPPKKKSSVLKWLALAVGLLTIFVVFGVAFVLYQNLSGTKEVSEKPKVKTTPKPTAKPKNQNKPINTVVNSNSNDWKDVNANTAGNKDEDEETQADESFEEELIIDEQVSVDENAHIAFPFEVKAEKAEILGQVEPINGEEYEGYVFLQSMYDAHSVTPIYKMFSFNSKLERKTNIRQFLPKGQYVLVFANNDGNGCTVKAKLKQVPFQQ